MEKRIPSSGGAITPLPPQIWKWQKCGQEKAVRTSLILHSHSHFLPFPASPVLTLPGIIFSITIKNGKSLVDKSAPKEEILEVVLNPNLRLCVTQGIHQGTKRRREGHTVEDDLDFYWVYLKEIRP
jgi:hypothetical protein